MDNIKNLMKRFKAYEAFYRSARDYNEQDTRDEFISPLLEALGWDVHNKKGVAPQYKEVVVEKFSNEKERPDYTLTLNGVSKIFVEAKKPSVDITIETEPAMQTRRYGWNAKHRLTILTNFMDLLIYDTTNKPESGDGVTVSLYKKYHYTEYEEKFLEIQRLISRETVYSGEYDEFTSKNFPGNDRYSTEIDEVFLTQLNNWRLLIAKDLFCKDDKYHDVDVLNDVVQEFLNQIIFLRICEDRNLPLYKKLIEAAKDRDDLKNSLTKVFREVDHKYNSGLFYGENIIFDLENDIIFDMIMSLYYPKAPYMFAIIEPGILGKIYESFLTESLIIEGGEVKLQKKAEYKNRSIVSTPVEIVKYMVRSVLSTYCSGKTPEEIKELKIADIACGSGVFLEEAYQFLVDECISWYETNNPEHLIELSNGRKKLPLQDKKELLLNCIYGIDIDVHAVEASRFSLLIKLMEDETEASIAGANPVLPSLEKNVRCGNSLIERADLGSAVPFTSLKSINPFNWSDLGLEDGFDIILGNPPYVKTEDMHTLDGDLAFNVYKSKFKSAYKQFDKYFLFAEKALSLLKPQGRLAYIIPNKFFKIDAGKELRRLLANHVIRIDDFGDMQLFPDKTIYSSIVFLGTDVQNHFEYTKVESLTNLWLGENLETVSLANSSLDDNPWALTTDFDFMKIISGIEAVSVPLDSVVDIFNGIQTSAERPPIYWFDRSEIVSEDKDSYVVNKFGKTYKIEKEILRPYFKPTKADEKGMSTYSVLDTNKRIIFPYDRQGKLIDIDTMKTRYAGAYAYLEDQYAYLVPRCLNNGKGRDIKGATSETWYQYGRSQALSSFSDTPKLIVRVLSKVPMYAYDVNDMLIASGGTAGYVAIAAKPGSKYALEFIQAWLDHPFTEKLFQVMGSDFEGGFTARGTFLLKKIPIVDLNFNDSKQKALYDKVIGNMKKIYELNDLLKEKHDKATKEAIEKEKDLMISLIREDITKIYQLRFG